MVTNSGRCSGDYFLTVWIVTSYTVKVILFPPFLSPLFVVPVIGKFFTNNTKGIFTFVCVHAGSELLFVNIDVKGPNVSSSPRTFL